MPPVYPVPGRRRRPGRGAPSVAASTPAACSAAPPSDVRVAVQYGPRFNAVMANLHGTHLLPYERVAQLYGDPYGHRSCIVAVKTSLNLQPGRWAAPSPPLARLW